MIHICDGAIIDVTGVEQFPIISTRENNQKLLHACGMLSYNISNYLIKRPSEWDIIMLIIRYKLIKITLIIIIKNQRVVKINKLVCFHIIPYIHSPMKGFSAHISGYHNCISRCNSYIIKLNGLNSRDKISFSAMHSPNIPSLTVLLEHFQINQAEQARTGLLQHNAQIKHPGFNNNVRQDLPPHWDYVWALTLLTYQILMNMYTDHNKNLSSQ